MYFIDPNPGGEPAVLLIHALGTDSNSWGFQIQVLVEKNMRPIAPDLPGFGRTPFPGGRWTIKKSAAEIKLLLTQLGFLKIPVVGISLGGAIALQFLVDYPEMVEKALLVNSFACLRPRKLKEFIYLGHRYIRANLKGAGAQAEMVAAHLFPREDQQFLRDKLIEGILNTNPIVYKGAMQQIALFNVRKKLKDIHVPITVVSGRDDKTVGLAIQNELARQITGAKHIIIPDSGHAVIVDQPDLFNRALLEFMNQSSMLGG
jgi:3-oxoadipate enol-lactonase